MVVSVGGDILIKAPNWLGDTVLSLPALGAVEASFPHSSITVVGNGTVRDVIAMSRLRADFVYFDRHAKGGGGLREPVGVRLGNGRRWAHEEGRGRRGTWREALRALRGRNWTLGLTFAESFSSALLLRLAGARNVFGYAGDSRSFLLSRSLPRRRLGLRPHLVREYMALAVEAGASPGDESPALSVPLKIREDAAALMSEAGVDTSKPLAGICPGAAYGLSKRWPADKFAAVAGELSRRGAGVVVFGAPSEAEVSVRIARAVSGAVSLAGLTTPAGLAGCLSQCRVVVANDSGAAHLAAAVSTPVVAIFGSTDASWTRPLGPKVVVANIEDMPCAPCFGTECDRGYACLTGITEEEVISAALAVSEGALG
jgi:heptosyltransferase-2